MENAIAREKMQMNARYHLEILCQEFEGRAIKKSGVFLNSCGVVDRQPKCMQLNDRSLDESPSIGGVKLVMRRSYRTTMKL